MRRQIRTFSALAAGVTLGFFAACSTSQCKDMRGSTLGDLVCGGEGAPAPAANAVVPSACQPRAVMPQFFALIDSCRPDAGTATSLECSNFDGLAAAVKDLGTPQCTIPDSVRKCASSDECRVGDCTNGLCTCTAAYSPLNEIIGLTLHGLAIIAHDDKAEPGAVGTPACLNATQAALLAPADRNRICELRRTLDIFLLQQGGTRLIDDPAVKQVLISLLDYVQGKTDGKEHYDLFTGLGRMASADSTTCDPAAIWTLLDNGLGYLTPQVAKDQLGAIQVLLHDAYTKQFLANLSSGGSAQGRDSMIVLVNGLAPSLVAAPNGTEALKSIDQLLTSLVYNNSNVPQSFKDEVQTVRTNVGVLLSDQAGLFPPLQKVLRCANSALVRNCADQTKCTNHENELIGALYDILSRPEASGGVDLSTLVGALKTLVTMDTTGQTGRTLRLVVQGIEGPADPNEPHDARDAVAQLAQNALTAQEGKKLLPALSVLIEKQVVTEIFALLQDLLYTCKPPTP